MGIGYTWMFNIFSWYIFMRQNDALIKYNNNNYLKIFCIVFYTQKYVKEKTRFYISDIH